MLGQTMNVDQYDNGIAFSSCQYSTTAIIDFKNQKYDLVRCNYSPVTKLYPASDNELYSVLYDIIIGLLSNDVDNLKDKKLLQKI